MKERTGTSEKEERGFAHASQCERPVRKLCPVWSRATTTPTKLAMIAPNTPNTTIRKDSI
jgi:hypothetical protein